MSLPKLSFSNVLLIIINVVPLYGVWFEGWDPLKIFIVYCMETVIIGILNVVKMALASFFNETGVPDPREKTRGAAGGFIFLFLIVFFIVHYGFFVFVQTQIFMGIVKIDGNGLLGSYTKMFRYLGEDGKLLLLIFCAYYSLELIVNFLLPGKFRTTSPLILMFQPYGRIIIQQFIVILGSFFLIFGAGKIFILVFVLVKLIADILMSRFFESKMQEAIKKSENEKNQVENVL